jgi:putative zinc finger protein/FecR-like protein
MQACKRVQENLWRYIDRELSAPALAEISAHLKTCRECQRLFEARSCDVKLYRMAFVGSPFGESFVERFRHRLEGQPAPVNGAVSRGAVSRGGASDDDPPVKASSLHRSIPRRLLARMALAAALVTIGVSVLIGLRPDAALGTVTLARGEATLLRGGKAMASPAGDLRVGDRFTLDGADDRLLIELSDGSALTLSGPADFLVEEGSRNLGHFIGWLDRGELRATVSHRGKDQEMKLFSPDAVARVVGTRFTLRVEPSRGTTLEVQEGEVRFRGYGGEEVPVTAATRPSFVSRGVAPPTIGAPEPPAAAPPIEESNPAPGVAPSPMPAPVSAGRPELDQPAGEKSAPEVPKHIREGVDLPAPR